MATRPPKDSCTLQLGRYLLFEAIARGGMATVHFGRLSDPSGFSRTVAIKRLHANFATDPEFVAMFLDEARLAGRIRHPNVVPTVDVVAAGGEVFIVLEYVSGESLGKLWRAHMAKGECVPVPFSLAVVANVLQGLHAAHEVRDEQGEPLGIVHRDVSPQNIMVGTDGVARVLDFGVAKATGRLRETGDSGAIKGKVAYMAPEQISGGDVSRQTDVYAASVVLWELLAGRRLVDGDNDAQRAARILGAVSAKKPIFEPPSRYNSQVSPELDALVLRGLAWPPSARFATAKEMAGQLERNGGLVAATEIGDWVARLAGPALEERAERLHAIESASGREKSAPDRGDGPISVPCELELTMGVAPPVFVEPAPVVLGMRRRSGAFALFTLGLIIAGGATAGMLAWSTRTSERSAAAGGEPPPVAQQPSVSAATPAPAGTAETAASAARSAPRADAPPPPPPPLASTTKAAPRPRPPPAVFVARPPPKLDCDPPYLIDDENHKVYKRECLD